MGRKIVLYIAMSLDGYIAKINGAVDWLEDGGENVDTGYEAFYSQIDTVVMGRTTFEQIVNELSPDAWVYEGRKCYVATTRPHEFDSRAEFISGDVAGFIKSLKSQEGKDIWIVGGGKLIDQFVKQDLIDEYIVTVIPIILGDGIPLFVKGNSEIKLRLVRTEKLGEMVQLRYIRD